MKSFICVQIKLLVLNNNIWSHLCDNNKWQQRKVFNSMQTLKNNTLNERTVNHNTGWNHLILNKQQTIHFKSYIVCCIWDKHNLAINNHQQLICHWNNSQTKPLIRMVLILNNPRKLRCNQRNQRNKTYMPNEMKIYLITRTKTQCS